VSGILYPVRLSILLGMKVQILSGCHVRLAQPSYGYLTVFYDDSHCPSAVRASERSAVVCFGWFQRDAFAAAQADYPRGASWTGLVLFLVAS
jgi:hypothetical protein